MKIKNVTIIATIIILIFGLSNIAIAAKTKSGAVSDILKIQNVKIFNTLTKSPVTLNHTKHYSEYKITCEQCHHVYKDKKSIWREGEKVQKCSECHNSPKENAGEMLSLYNAYHKNCRDCHKELKKGPTKCDECHPKKIETN